MKYTLADKDITILEHLVHVAEKSAKTIQFCFRKGKHQTYINPKKELFVSFDLQTPIDFDYPIANLKTFLSNEIRDLDPDKNNVDIKQLVLPTDKDEDGFNTQIIQEIDLLKDERILYVNYFALKSQYVKRLADKYQNNLIIDNTQDFFEKPLENIDTIYSPRKFFGVSDGGYLYVNHLLEQLLTFDESYIHSEQLLGRADKEASLFYNEYIKAEQRLINQPIRKMSNLTNKILSSINYERIKQKRKENFAYLHNELKEINLLENIDIKSTPFIYPFLTNDLQLREKLIKNKIYIAKYWSEVLDRDSASNVEIDFVNKLIPLPIDQRYDFDDMCRILKIIKDNI